MPLQAHVTNLDASPFLGRLALLRIHNGTLKKGADVGLARHDGTIQRVHISELLATEGLERVSTESAAPGDIVAVAGMEGALPSVVAGLASCPVIAVPTSVGYGASFGGVTALLAMLNSCASGVSVVNIDNGFGAGYQASLINHRR